MDHRIERMVRKQLIHGRLVSDAGDDISVFAWNDIHAQRLMPRLR